MSEDVRISLAAARVNAGLTQEQASAAIGVNRVTLWNWENGKSSPDVENAVALAALYKMPLNAINFARKVEFNLTTKAE